MSRFWIDEWFVVTLARTIRDRETVFHGFASPCAQVAMHLARRTHAPDMLLIEGATYAVNPDPAFLPSTGNDLALERGAVYRMRFEEFFDAAIRGDIDRMFLSGTQIDAYGKTNVTAVGPVQRPKVKMGGGVGGCNVAATVGRLTLWTTRHRSGRVLVDHCDFATDMGHRTPEAAGANWATPARARSGWSRSRASSTTGAKAGPGSAESSLTSPSTTSAPRRASTSRSQASLGW